MTSSLFRSTELTSVLAGQEQLLSKDVRSLSEDQILRTAPADLCDFFLAKYSVDPIVIDESGIEVDYEDIQIDISRRSDYMVFDQSRPTHVAGTRISFFLPFSGDADLFGCRPSRTNFNAPRGLIRGLQLVFMYDCTTQDDTAIKNEFERDKQNLNKHLSWIADDVGRFNSAMRQKVAQEIEARRAKVLRDKGIAENLGFPLKRRPNAPTTYTAPDVRRRIVPKLPSVSAQPYTPEPALDLAEYEHILSVVSNMVVVMERSPKAFKDMGEEDLRQHFLVQLNGQYEGQATGETFNYEGKTDILIRAQGKNIFIAECKFWSGPSSLSHAIDQLLSYTSWRDTKTALLMFNRDTTMSTVLKRIPEAVREHPDYKADGEFYSETGFRYVFGHRDDHSRELTLTVLVFDVPGTSTAATTS